MAHGKLFYPLFTALALTGCVSGTMSRKPSESDPANPDAPQTAFVAEQNALLVLTNWIAVGTNAAPAQEHDHGHEQHKAK